MTPIRYYLDEDATSRSLLQSLRNRGADVISAADTGMLAQPDEAQLEWALANQRVIFPSMCEIFTESIPVGY